MMKTLILTPAILAALEAVRDAEQRYEPGRDSAAVIELPQLDLADAILAAIAAQTAARRARLETLPKARPVPVVVEVALRRKWRRGPR